jgi:hypothetical protein
MQSGALAASANDLIFGFGVGDSIQVGTGFTARRRDSDDLTEEKIVTAAGSYQATATAIGSPNWSMLGAAFRGR